MLRTSSESNLFRPIFIQFSNMTSYIMCVYTYIYTFIYIYIYIYILLGSTEHGAMRLFCNSSGHGEVMKLPASRQRWKEKKRESDPVPRAASQVYNIQWQRGPVYSILWLRVCLGRMSLPTALVKKRAAWGLGKKRTCRCQKRCSAQETPIAWPAS